MKYQGFKPSGCKKYRDSKILVFGNDSIPLTINIVYDLIFVANDLTTEFQNLLNFHVARWNNI